MSAEADAEQEFWDAARVADEAGYVGKHREASARKLMSRLEVASELRHNERGRPQAYYPAKKVREALGARTGHPTGGGRKLRKEAS